MTDQLVRMGSFQSNRAGVSQARSLPQIFLQCYFDSCSAGTLVDTCFNYKKKLRRHDAAQAIRSLEREAFSPIFTGLGEVRRVPGLQFYHLKSSHLFSPKFATKSLEGELKIHLINLRTKDHLKDS